MSWLVIALLAAADAGTPAQVIRVQADRFDIYAKENRAQYQGHVRAERGTTVIRSDRLQVFYAPGPSGASEVTRVEADGHAEADDGARHAQGEHADFDNRTGVLVMTGQPQAQAGGSQVAGARVTFTAGSEVLEVDEARTVLGEAQGTARGERVDIRADKLTVYDRKHLAVWSGRVKARRGEADIRTAKLVAFYDEAAADAGSAEPELHRLEATGGVEVTEKDRWAQGERADFDNRTGVLVVTGRPQARQGTNHMKGSRVVFTVGKDVLQVEDATTVIHPAPRPSPKGKK